MVLNANHETERWRGIEIKRGQFVSGIHTLSQESGLSERSIRTSIERLKSTGELTSKSTNKFTLYTIVKYSDYQDKQERNDKQNDKQSDRQATSKRQANDKQPTTNNNDNKETRETTHANDEKIQQLQIDLINSGAGDFGIQISNAMQTNHPVQVENGIANFIATGNKKRATWNYIQKFIDSAPQTLTEKKDPYDDGPDDF